MANDHSKDIVSCDTDRRPRGGNGEVVMWFLSLKIDRATLAFLKINRATWTLVTTTLDLENG